MGWAGCKRLNALLDGASLTGVPTFPPAPTGLDRPGVDDDVEKCVWGEVDSWAAWGVGEGRLGFVEVVEKNGSAHLTPTIQLPPRISPFRLMARRASSSEANVTVSQFPPDGSEKEEVIGPRVEKWEMRDGWREGGGPKRITWVAEVGEVEGLTERDEVG